MRIFLKDCAIIRLNIKERLDIYQEINNMAGFTVGDKLIATPGLTEEQIAQIEKEKEQKQEAKLLEKVTEETFAPIERTSEQESYRCWRQRHHLHGIWPDGTILPRKDGNLPQIERITNNDLRISI